MGYECKGGTYVSIIGDQGYVPDYPVLRRGRRGSWHRVVGVVVGLVKDAGAWCKLKLPAFVIFGHWSLPIVRSELEDHGVNRHG